MHLTDPNHDQQGNAMVIGLTRYSLFSSTILDVSEHALFGWKRIVNNIKFYVQPTSLKRQ